MFTYTLRVSKTSGIHRHILWPVIILTGVLAIAHAQEAQPQPSVVVQPELLPPFPPEEWMDREEETMELAMIPMEQEMEASEQAVNAQRQAERAQRQAERAQEQAERAREQAERARRHTEDAISRGQTTIPQDELTQAYQDAYGYTLDEKWIKARQAFDKFLKRYGEQSGNRYADDARFWICYAMEKSKLPDEEIFNAYYQFIQDYEKSKWVDDAKANLIRVSQRLIEKNKKNKAKYGPIVEQLQKDYDDEVAVQALYGLRRMGDKGSLKAIIDMYDRSDNPALRMKILYTLQRFDDPVALQKLMDVAQQEPDPGLRREAIHALGHHSIAIVLPVLRMILTSSDDVMQRRQAIGALRQLGGDEADEVIPILLKVARTDPHVKVRTEAVSALGHIGTPAAQEALIQILEGK